ncbi:MAG: hypothetical protein EZS28_045217, partial [Streblomastix strix]
MLSPIQAPENAIVDQLRRITAQQRTAYIQLQREYEAEMRDINRQIKIITEMLSLIRSHKGGMTKQIEQLASQLPNVNMDKFRAHKSMGKSVGAKGGKSKLAPKENTNQGQGPSSSVQSKGRWVEVLSKILRKFNLNK